MCQRLRLFIEDYRVLASKIWLVKVIHMSHVASSQFAFENNRSIGSYQHSNSCRTSSGPRGSFCINLKEFTYKQVKICAKTLRHKKYFYVDIIPRCQYKWRGHNVHPTSYSQPNWHSLTKPQFRHSKHWSSQHLRHQCFHISAHSQKTDKRLLSFPQTNLSSPWIFKRNLGSKKVWYLEELHQEGLDGLAFVYYSLTPYFKTPNLLRVNLILLKKRCHRIKTKKHTQETDHSVFAREHIYAKQKTRTRQSYRKQTSLRLHLQALCKKLSNLGQAQSCISLCLLHHELPMLPI